MFISRADGRLELPFNPNPGVANSEAYPGGSGGRGRLPSLRWARAGPPHL